VLATDGMVGEDGDYADADDGGGGVPGARRQEAQDGRACGRAPEQMLEKALAGGTGSLRESKRGRQLSDSSAGDPELVVCTPCPPLHMHRPQKNEATECIICALLGREEGGVHGRKGGMDGPGRVSLVCFGTPTCAGMLTTNKADTRQAR